MALKNQILDMSPLGMIFTVLNTGRDTAGRSLDLHWELMPGCNTKDPLVHVHPNAIETYEILKGEMEFFVVDKWIPAKKGDKISVPKGVTHTFRNPGTQVVTVFNTHQPALRMENYFEDIIKILDKLTDNRKQEFKMDFRSKLYLSVLMNNYRDEIIGIDPPDLVLRVMAAFARAMRISY